MPVTQRVLLVDGNNILVRAIKAMEGHGVEMSSDGVNTGPLVVFVNCISRYVKEIEPDRMVVCWDGGRSPYRMGLYSEYKANRGEHPVHDLEQSNFALAKEFLTLSSIHHVQVPNVEADDIIAHYWRSKLAEDRIVILSGDKDFLQLVDGWTEQVQPGVDKRWTANQIRTDLGCRAQDLPYVKALTGDSSDCIPGLPGFGHKTAIKALVAHEWDFDALLKTTDPKWVKKIAGFEEQARMNLALMDLRHQAVPLITALPTAELGEVPKFSPTTSTGLLWRELIDFCRRYRLASIESRLRDERLWRPDGKG